MKLSLLLVMALLSSACANPVEEFHLAPAPNMERADLYYLPSSSTLKAVLVLCPGVNRSGEELVSSPVWQKFARSNNLGLVGLSFSSPLNHIKDGLGYYYASKGSGDQLLEGIRNIYGGDPPLLLYGFSGGAQFTSRFEEYAPDHVLTWCAYSAEWWDIPLHKAQNPPGLVACGESDAVRYGASITYFKQGRAVGKPWVWISLPRTDHENSPLLDDFVRKYFSACLNGGSNLSRGVWVDVDTKLIVSEQEAQNHPSLSAWLPTQQLYDDWKTIHEP
jgi:pimeloyl-ACP methyl ester carboxylesterase